MVEPDEARYLQRLGELDEELGHEGKEAIRRRIEAAEDERERARARGEAPPLPTLDDDDGRPTGEMFGDDEDTKVISAKAARDAVAHAAAPSPHAPPHPIQSTRPTLLGGIAGTPPPSVVVVSVGNMRRGERVMTRFYNLAAHHKAKHCAGPTCEPSGGVCGCACDTCALRRTLLARAEREIVG